MKAFCVIPARLGSTRLSEKPLLNQTGKFLVQHVYEQARQAQLTQGVGVATDDPRVLEAVESFGGVAWLTRADHASGTDRVAEVAQRWIQADVLVNVQGDEPEVSPGAIDRVVQMLRDDPAADLATLATPIRDPQAWRDPACVKVVCNRAGAALYFSRSPLPYVRDGEPDFRAAPPVAYQHLGLYAYRREALLRLASLPPSRLEQLEKLEQLRALENGLRIKVEVIDEAGFGIDTPEDYRRFVERYRQRQIEQTMHVG
jgi:3-deoxy-manno-octulosonate cytidylyltransferase (CMP-KDO synthetase)